MSAAPQTTSVAGKNVIAIHGGWHTSWWLTKVLPHLKNNNRDYELKIADFPTHVVKHFQKQSIPVPPSLDEYVEWIKEIISTFKNPNQKLVVLAHSAGGVVAAKLIDTLGSEKFDKLICLACILPPNNHSLVDVLIKDTESVLVSKIVQPTPQSPYGIHEDFVKHLFYHQCSDEDAELAKQNLNQQEVFPGTEKLVYKGDALKKVPKYYMKTLFDQAFGPKLQDVIIGENEIPTSNVVELDTDHSPFLSKPEKFAEIFEQLILK